VVAFEDSLLQPAQQLRLRDPIGRLQSGQAGCVYGVALDPDDEQIDEASLSALYWTGRRYRLQPLSKLSDRVDPSAASAYEKLESQLDRPQSLLVVDGQLWIGQQGARGLVSYTPPTDLARSALCPGQDQR
jgi:hypothetical protein